MSAVENPYAGQGAVLLDIGDDIGALVVEMPRAMVGVEVEARALEGAQVHHHPHVAVVERPGPTAPVPSLVFPELREGRYELVPKGGGPAALITSVRGGLVTSVSWT